MEREAFRQRMQHTSERPITNFDPKGDPYNPTYGYNPGAGYVSNSDLEL